MTATEQRHQADTDESDDQSPSSEGMHQPEQPQTAGRSTAQLITTVISVLLIALLAGAILYEGYVDRANSPAEIRVAVQTDQAEQRGEHWYVPILIRNLGDDTVEELVIAIDVRRGDETILETDTTIAQLGEAAETTATIVLDEDPADLTIDATAETFQVAEE